MAWTQKQVEAFALLSDPNIQQAALFGGSGSGKTFVAGHKFRQRAIEFPGCLQIILRKTMADCRDTVWSRMMINNVLRYDLDRRFCKEYKQPAKVVYNNGSEIRIGGLHPSEIDKVLGPDYATMWPNEASEVSWKNVPPMRTRLRDKSTHREHGGPIKPMLMLDFNPTTTMHWLHDVFMLGVDPDSKEPLPDREKWGHLLMNPHDNIENLPPEYIPMLESMSSRDRERFLYGRFGQLKGLVYDCFHPELNIYDELPHTKGQWYRGIDLGFVNPFVCLWGMLGSDDTLYIESERYLAGITIPTHAKAIKEFPMQISDSWADHDAGEVEQLLQGGVDTSPAIKDVTAGIGLVYDMIERRKIKVNRRCINLLREFGSYEWKEGAKKDEVNKKNDHACDALRYLVMGIFKIAPKPAFHRAR